MHARPSMKFVDVANKFASEIVIGRGDLKVNAKSIMSLTRIAAVHGTEITVYVDGPDEEEAMDAIAELVGAGFYDDP